MRISISPRVGRTDYENEVDRHVGARVKLRRTLIGVSQEKLGDACGITFQQVQKYESGGNRISASRLVQIGKVLGVPPAFFFEGLPTEGEVEALDPMKSNGALELVKRFNRCAESDQEAILALLKSLATAPAAIAARSAA